MNAVTNPQLSSSVDTDEHDNRKERGNIETLRTTKTQDGEKPDDNTFFHNDHLTRDNTCASKPENSSYNTFNQNETQKAQEDNKNTSETTQNDTDSRSNTFSHDTENESDTSYHQELSKDAHPVKEKTDTRDETLDNHGDMNDADSRFDINHDTSVKEENESDTSYHQELSIPYDTRDEQKTEEPEENIKDDNWVTRDETFSHEDKKAQERAESVEYDNTSVKEDSETETRQEISIPYDRCDDTKIEAHEDNAKDDKNTREETLTSVKEDSETETPQEISIPYDRCDDTKNEADGDNAKDDKTVQERLESVEIKEDSETETRQELSKTEDSCDDKKVDKPEETRYRSDDQKAEEPYENAKDDNWLTRDESLDNRHDQKVEADEAKNLPSSDLWNETSVLHEPETHDDTKATEYKPKTDDDTSIRTERLVVDDENDTRDTFSISATDNDIRDSLFVEKTRIDDDSFIHTERLVVDDDDSRDTLSVPSELETYKKTDESDDDTFNRREKLLIDDENDTRDTHTLSVPSDTKTSYKLKAEEQTSDNTLTHHRETQTRYDTNESIRDEVFSVDKSNNRYDKELVSHDDEKAPKTGELDIDNNEQLDDEFADLSPGTILHQAREQQRLSVKHIADRLYLDVHVIEALEADDYEILPPTIFVRGYLRNYAKLLEIPTTSIMSAFDKLQQPTMVPVFTAPSKPKRQASSRDLWAKLVTFTVAISLLIGVALWQFYPNSSSAPQLAVNPGTPGENFPPVINDTVIETEQQLTGMNGIETGNDPQKNADKPSNSDENRPDESEKQEEPAPSEPTLQTMQVRFKERSWVRISDKTGKRLYQGIGNAGEILPLEGTQPFQVHVGNVSGVSVEYNGEIKDIRNYPRQRRSRRIFIVGSDD